MVVRVVKARAGRRKTARFLLVLALVLLFSATLIQTASAMYQTYQEEWDLSNDEPKTMSIDILSDFDIIDSGDEVDIVVGITSPYATFDEVTFSYENCLEGAWVTAEIINGGEKATISAKRFVTNENGEAVFTFRANVGEKTDFLISFEAKKDGFEPAETEFSITVIPDKPIASPVTLWSAFIGLVVTLVVASTEVGKYGLLTLTFPLYTRIKKEEVLDHFVRGQIYGYIMSHPGKNYNAIKQDLKVTNGTLSHHLKTLEMQGFVKSRRVGTHRLFYPVDTRFPHEKGIKLSDLQLNILDIIRQSSGVTQSDIAGILNVSQQTVSYNLRVMSRESIIRVERVGKTKVYYIQET